MASSKKAGGAKKSAGSKKATSTKKATGAKKAAGPAKKATGAKKAVAAKKTAGLKAAAAAPVSFARQIAPMFREMDVQCMRGRGVFLRSYDYMKDPGNADEVLQRLLPEAGLRRMPYGGPYWTNASIKLFQDWISGGLQP